MNNEQRALVDRKVAKLEKKIERLEKALIEARLERANAMYCLVCDEVKCVCPALVSSAGKVVGQ